MEEEKTKPTPKVPAKRGQPSASEEGASPYPEMSLAQEIHKLTALKLDAQPLLHKVATELENPSLYRLIGGGSLSEAALKELEDKNAKHLEELEAKVEDAKENAGDMEVMDARIEIARFAAKTLTKDQALEAYQKLLDLPKVSSGKKIDALMESARVASFYGDQKKSAEFIESVSTVNCALSRASHTHKWRCTPGKTQRLTRTSIMYRLKS